MQGKKKHRASGARQKKITDKTVGRVEERNPTSTEKQGIERQGLRRPEAGDRKSRVEKQIDL